MLNDMPWLQLWWGVSHCKLLPLVCQRELPARDLRKTMAAAAVLLHKIQTLGQQLLLLLVRQRPSRSQTAGRSKGNGNREGQRWIISATNYFSLSAHQASPASTCRACSVLRSASGSSGASLPTVAQRHWENVPRRG